MHAEKHATKTADATDGVRNGRLATLVLHNNSATITQCPDDYKPTPKDIPYPRPNNVLEEALAVSVMVSAFALGVSLPFILMGCIPAVMFYKSKVAAAILVATAVDWLLPPGTVRSTC